MSFYAQELAAVPAPKHPRMSPSVSGGPARLWAEVANNVLTETRDEGRAVAPFHGTALSD
jgi:hypothetical protein